MRLVMLYRPGSDKAGLAEDYAAEYARRNPGKKIELLSLDTVAGAEMAKLYGVTNNPAILTISTDGILLQMWQDEHLPLMDELNFYGISR